MPEAAGRRDRNAGATPFVAPRRDDGTEALRDLIVGPERDRLAALQARFDDRDARRRELGEVLPDALQQHALDPEFARALAPGMERAITESVRQNPTHLADALFPVMGPAIRKAVASALSGMVDSLNRTLEHSLSWRSLGWRYEAMKSGKSFAEVVLLHTLLYRVEQLFLIERTSGLLLQHVSASPGNVKDADMVSGMMTAIRDFVHDSFTVSAGEGLESLRVGELTIWIEQGPRAVIAAVLRGTAPRTYHTRLQHALESIHLQFSEALSSFSGDTTPFAASRPILESCLQAEYRADEAKPKSRRLVWFAAAAAVLLAVWVGFTVRDRLRWNAYLDTLRAEPGVVIVSSGRDWGRFVVSGLRDPLARDPAAILSETSIQPEDVAARWEPYYASHPALAAARARQVLKPPDGVTLDVRDGVLSTSGAAPVPWLVEADKLAPLIPGVRQFDLSGALDAAAKAAIGTMENLAPLFAKGGIELADGQEEVLRTLTSSVQDLEAAATAAQKRFRIEVIGHADTDGSPEINEFLSQARADVVRAAFERINARHLEILSRGVGSNDPAVPPITESDKQRNRRVTVHVTSVAV